MKSLPLSFSMRYCLAVRALSLSAAAILALTVSTTASAITVGGFDASRTLFSSYSIYEPTSGANAELTDPANWPLYGAPITLAPGTATATAGYLAGVDVFVTGLLDFDAAALTPAEVSSLSTFIDGGGVVIAYGDNLSFDETVDDLLNVYGLDINNASYNTGTTSVFPVMPAHPVITGPFGVVGTHEVRDSAYLLTASGPGAILATYTSGDGAIGAAGPGVGQKGALVFFPDSETYGLDEADFRGQPDAEIAFNNAIAWAVSIVPEPASTTIAAGVFLLLASCRGRRN